MNDDRKSATGTPSVPPWPPVGASARTEALERYRSARVAGDGVLFSLWCGARHVVGFVPVDALAALAGRAVDETQWLATYKANVRKIHTAARDQAAYRSDSVEPLVVATSAFE